MRAARLFGLFSFAFVILCIAQNAQAQTYELGPFHVEGVGVTPQEAEEQAYIEMWDQIISIENSLPPGDVVLDYIIINEGLVGPNLYEIDFIVICGPLPPVGPGGGGGGPGM